MKLIAYTIEQVGDKVAITVSEGLKITGDDPNLLLQCFIRDSQPKPFTRGQDILNVCWDLDTSIAPLLKLLGEKRCRKLHETNRCYHAPFNIFYMPGKVFSIKPVYSKRRTNLYNLQQYFPEIDEPDNISVIAGMGDLLLEALAEMNLYPKKLTSPVAIWEQEVMNHLTLPTAWDMPQEAAEYAYNCSGKLWTEAYKIGYFDKAYDYDIVSSFPSVARDLIDIRHCDWIEAGGYEERAIYGYCNCKVTIWEDIVASPIIHEDEQGNLSTPTGTWKTYLTKTEIDFIRNWDIGHVYIYNGWWAIPGKRVKPLEIPMARLLNYKESNDPLVRYLAKRISVGVYGKFGEEWADRFAPHFNPCWFAEISTQVRLQVAEFIYQHELQDNLTHVSVDGVLLDKEVKL